MQLLFIVLSLFREQTFNSIQWMKGHSWKKKSKNAPQHPSPKAALISLEVVGFVVEKEIWRSEWSIFFHMHQSPPSSLLLDLFYDLGSEEQPNNPGRAGLFFLRPPNLTTHYWVVFQIKTKITTRRCVPPIPPSKAQAVHAREHMAEVVRQPTNHQCGHRCHCETGCAQGVMW